MTATMKKCVTCGAEFKRSPSDSTVNCPKHRGAKRETTRSFTAVACCRCGHVHTTLRCDRCGF